jgi:carbamoyl-phosphate synthase/aspartate carbamoyltransferase/dihydroorotase
MAALFDHPVHIAHVSLREEILLIRKAKEKGIKVTCEVAPHHLFLTIDDIPSIGSGRSEVRPRLASTIDQAALWNNMDVIDVFATDHAPHTLTEKDSEKPPPGFPGLETALPLFLTAVQSGRLNIDDMVSKMYTNPKNIFSIPTQPETWIEVDTQKKWIIKAEDALTRCGWTPFEGRTVIGQVHKVVLRGTTVYRDRHVLAKPGNGKNIRNLDEEFINQ